MPRRWTSPTRTSTFVSAMLAVCALTTAIRAAPADAASAWLVGLDPTGQGLTQAQSQPTAPDNVTADCQSSGTSVIVLAWAPVANATSYSVYQSITSASTGYTLIQTVTTTSWTTAPLAKDNYWFTVTATVGTAWQSPASIVTTQRKIVGNSNCR